MEKAGPNHPVQVIDFGIKKKKQKSSRPKKQYICPFGDDFVVPDVCQGLHNKDRFNCLKITLEDVLAFRRRIYATHDKISQENFLVNYVYGCEPKRRRIRKNSPQTSYSARHGISMLYTLEKQEGKRINVCKAMFLAVTGISKKRIVSVAKQISRYGVIAENRGGDRRSTVFEDKKIVKLVQKTEQRENYIPLAQLERERKERMMVSEKPTRKNRKRVKPEHLEVVPEQVLIETELIEPKSEVLGMEFFDRCRICLQNESGLIYLFENATEDQTYADLVVFCLPLQVTSNNS
jgi:hypothetical protein